MALIGSNKALQGLREAPRTSESFGASQNLTEDREVVDTGVLPLPPAVSERLGGHLEREPLRKAGLRPQQKIAQNGAQLFWRLSPCGEHPNTSEGLWGPP